MPYKEGGDADGGQISKSNIMIGQDRTGLHDK